LDFEEVAKQKGRSTEMVARIVGDEEAFAVDEELICSQIKKEKKFGESNELVFVSVSLENHR
jgi:hypothetical protein